MTTKSRAHYDKWHRRFQEINESKRFDTKEADDEHLDIVRSVCMDSTGNVAAALSSDGVLYNFPGRRVLRQRVLCLWSL